MVSALQLPTAQPLPRSMPLYICPSQAMFAVHVFAKGGSTTIKAWAAHQGEGDFNGTVVVWWKRALRPDYKSASRSGSLRTKS